MITMSTKMSDNCLEPISEPNCTVWCRSVEHAFQLMAAISGRPSTDRLQAYCRSVCHNFSLITDKFGRNMLHMSASTGDSRFVRWLIQKCNSDIDLKDSESGWTPLHRSIFYGQIECAKTLIELGANLNVLDRDHCTPLDLLMLDRPPYIEYIRTNPCDCYVWGSNVNFNLGVESEQSRKTPEIVITFKRNGIHIKEVIIRKFHTSFLTYDGKVLTCGHGHGGRLAQDSEDLSIIPKFISLAEASYVEAMASGQDHILLLVRHLRDNSVHIYSCGVNTYGVLGHSPPPEKLLAPKLICLKNLKLGSHQKLGDIIGVGAARYHSLFFTKEELFTFGLNVGQIGHLKGERTQLIPHRVSPLNFRDTGTRLEHVVTSDGAIVCATNKGEVFVLHEYQCRKIASQQLDIQQICVVGGHLDERTDVAGILDNSRIDLQIILLTKSGNIYLWKGTDPSLVRCLIGFGRELSVTHICLNIKTVGIVTKDGEVFFGSVSNRKSMKESELKRTSVENSSETTHKTSSKTINSKGGAQQVKSFVKFINKDECHTIHVKKQHHIQRAVAVFSDDQNRNFAVLQCSPKIGLLETASKPDSQMVSDIKSLYETSDLNDNIHDVVIKVGNRQYYCHKFILSNRSEYFRKKLSSDPECSSITFEQNFINSVDSFEQILKFIYFNSNDLFEDSKRLNWTSLKAVTNKSENNTKNIKQKDNKNKKSKQNSKSDPLAEVKDVSRKLGINWLNKWLTSNGVEIVGNKVKVIDKCFPPKLVFDKNRNDFCDLIIKSEDGIEFMCHKCILMSRLEYFRGMLSSGWIEASTNSALTLPIHSKILEIIMDYVYRDQSSKLESIEDPEFICHVLVIADQYLIPRLKTYCEYVLVNLLTLRNACELLELSYIYIADQLKRCCLDFICINLQTLIEANSLDVLSEEAMKELTDCYQNMITRPHNRRINRYSNAPKSEEFDKIFSLFDSSDDFEVNVEQKKALLKQKIRVKRSSNRHRNESTSSDILESEDIQMSKLSISSPKEESVLKKRLNSEEKQIKTEMLSPKDCKQIDLKTTNELSVKPKPIKWGLSSSTIPPPINLKDIITEEEKHFTKISKPKPIIPSNNIQSIVCQNPIPIPKRRSFRNSCSKSDEIVGDSHKSFAEMAVSPPKVHSNPWKKIESSSPTSSNISPKFVSTYPQIETISMKDIVRAEEEQLQNLKALQTKPLHIISVEDKAIEELLDFYKANSNPNEYITVERVVSRVAEPVWSRNQ